MRAILLILLLALNLIAYAYIRGWVGEPQAGSDAARIEAQLDPGRIYLAGDPPPPETLLAEAPAADEVASAAAQAVEEQAATVDGEETPAHGSSAADGEEAVAETAADQDPAEEDRDEPVAVADSEDGSGEEAAAEPLLSSCLLWANLTKAEADFAHDSLREAGVDAELRTISTPTSWWVRVPPQGSQERANEQAQALRNKGVKDLFIVREPGPTQFAISLGVFQTEARARVMLAELRQQGIDNADVRPRLAVSYEVEAELPESRVDEINRLLARLAHRRTACPPPGNP